MTSDDQHREFGQSYHEWLAENQNHVTPPDGIPVPEYAPKPAFTRAATWAATMGALWLIGTVIVVNFQDLHSINSPYLEHDPTHMLFGLAFLAWAVNTACELITAVQRKDRYPALGIWAWVTSARTRKAANELRRTTSAISNNGCLIAIVAALAFPGVFIAFSIMTTLSVFLWEIILYGGMALHILITVIRYFMWRRNATA
ncbi:hypothetical protein [Actinoallomurus iriomotensis]|uniref:Transmembrane protein n=1 Tax=Actinoallomurus iriomotensis TaxID=478107 RepID=A0A9W6RXP8_9ACTN|nr:hypothetical protein [Actinoallomurus iriomotensis]GLY82047.1 hypothetical protein Airi01_103140 [Actinoallomurus iriomotensis]